MTGSLFCVGGFGFGLEEEWGSKFLIFQTRLR